jgi:hypothetical protein
MELTLAGTALDTSTPEPTDPFTFDSTAGDTSTVASGGGSFMTGFSGLLTTIDNAVNSGIKATSSPAKPVTVRPGTTYMGANGQIIQVPGVGGMNTQTILLIGVGLVVAFLLIRRLA